MLKKILVRPLRRGVGPESLEIDNDSDGDSTADAVYRPGERQGKTVY